MIEQAVSFGTTHTLVGVVHEPNPEAADPSAPAILFLNAGLLNRSGPHRLYVTLCRALAKAGFRCMRFDHAGLGDSDGRLDQLSYASGVINDAVEAMDYLGDHCGEESFLMSGLCSGADHSFLTACQDRRVVGGIFFDWYAYRTRGYYLHHYVPRMFRLGPWIRTMDRAIQKLKGHRPISAQRQVDPYAREIPPASQVAEELQALLDQGSRFLCVYTGGQDELFNHKEQFFKMFPQLDHRGRLAVEYMPEAGHTFPIIEHRRALVEIVVRWARSLLGSG